MCFEKRTKLVNENKTVTISIPPPSPIPDKVLRKEQKEREKKKAMLDFTVYDEEIDICLKHFYAIIMQIILLAKEKIM